jgi:hypothetical protein
MITYRAYETLRASYRPPQVRVLFVGESAPAGGTFFYRANSQVYRYLKKSLHIARPDLFSDDAGFLNEFRKAGCYLDDLVLEPVNHQTEAARKRARTAGVPNLAERLADYRPRAVVSLMRAIEPFVSEAIVRSNLSVPHHVTAFPGCGQQVRFSRGMAEIIPCLPLPLRRASIS